MSQELGQFGSRLTGIEAQVKAGQDDLVKVQNSLQELPSTFSKTSLIDEGIDKVNNFLKTDSFHSEKKPWILLSCYALAKLRYFSTSKVVRKLYVRL